MTIAIANNNMPDKRINHLGHAVRRGESASLKPIICREYKAILKQVQDDGLLSHQSRCGLTPL